MSTCLIRLLHYDLATDVLSEIIQTEPLNFKALYHLSCCHRALNKTVEAVDTLTKV